MAEEDAPSEFLDTVRFDRVSAIPADSLAEMHVWDKELCDLFDDEYAPVSLAIDRLMSVPAFIRAPIELDRYYLHMFGENTLGPLPIKYDHELYALLEVMTPYNDDMKFIGRLEVASAKIIKVLRDLKTLDDIKNLPVDFLTLRYIGDHDSENREGYIDDCKMVVPPPDMTKFEAFLRDFSFFYPFLPLICVNLKGHLKHYGNLFAECNASCYGYSTKSILKFDHKITGKLRGRDNFLDISESDPDFCSALEDERYVINMCDVVMDLFFQFKRWYCKARDRISGTKCDLCLVRLFFAKYCMSLYTFDDKMENYTPVGWLPWRIREYRFQFSLGYTHRYAFVIAFCKLFAPKLHEILHVTDYIAHFPFDFDKFGSIVEHATRNFKGIFGEKIPKPVTVVPSIGMTSEAILELMNSR
uniref:Uncharacterized protein n=1 Tax=viral metagenome TaxID=1070528 RepID=A0A2V0RKC3_9ZZZZ